MIIRTSIFSKFKGLRGQHENRGLTCKMCERFAGNRRNIKEEVEINARGRRKIK